MPKRGKNPARKRARVDWTEARRLFEREGRNYTEIAEHFGCNRDTVSIRAKREGWVDPAQILRETRTERADELRRAFIRRDTDFVYENLAEKHRATQRILALVHRRLDLCEADAGAIEAQLSGIARDPITQADLAGVLERQTKSSLELRRLALVVSGIEVTDRNLAGLKDDGWRSSAGGSGADSELDAAAVRAALADLTREQPAGG